MDREILVEAKKEDGEVLIAELVSDGFDVTVAFWANTSDGGMWYLFIASKLLDRMDFAGAWHSLLNSWQRVRPCAIAISEIKLIHPNDPVAVGAIEAGHGTIDELATVYKKPFLGTLAIEEAYIYPNPKGPMSRNSVVLSVAHLMTRAGVPAPSVFILKDGTRTSAIPIGLQMTTIGGVDLVLQDINAGVNRSISADEVADIQQGRRSFRLMNGVLAGQGGGSSPAP